MHYEKVIPTKEDKKNSNWEGDYYRLVDDPKHTRECEHEHSAFGERCTCGVLKKLSKMNHGLNLI